ncbi:MAG TPA: deoxyribonuclease IV [Syntrophorhabdaceae bacterium]|jgi:apurinic endonuclease APN1
MMKIGFHVSVSKGFDSTLREAERLGCEAVQIFVKNPRSWAGKTLRDEEIEAFKRLSEKMPVFAHLSYLPNLAQTDAEARHMQGLLNELELCRRLGIGSMVVHCGSREDKKKGVEIVAETLNRALDKFDIQILLETAAGQGNAIGSRIPELAAIHDKVERKETVALCLDTSHMFESGYDLRSQKAWNDIIRSVGQYMGKEKIGLFHLNDSKTDLGSRVDRHWHIGEGKIGTRTFGFILKDKRFAGLCGVMETPKTGSMDEINMRTMKSLLSPLMSRSFA